MKEWVQKENLPRHIAMIMDGNGRWAKRKRRPAYLVIEPG